MKEAVIFDREKYGTVAITTNKGKNIKEGHKIDEGKLDWDYLPMEALPGVARVFQKGGIKYKGKRTWLPGIRFSTLFTSIWRHLFEWYYLGRNKDKESGEHPLCHVVANCLMLLTYIKNTAYDNRIKGVNNANKSK
jgi:hypothetical protein